MLYGLQFNGLTNLLLSIINSLLDSWHGRLEQPTIGTQALGHLLARLLVCSLTFKLMEKCVILWPIFKFCILYHGAWPNNF